MRTAASVLVFCSVLGGGLAEAQAQGLPGRAVELTRPGTRATVEALLAEDLAVVDRQDIDVDGDGDLDALLTVDVAEGVTEPKPDAGRGLVLAERTAQGWRGRTVASVRMFPREAGFAWGGVEAVRVGERPLLRVEYSAAGNGRGEQRVWLLAGSPRGELHAVYSAGVRSTGSGYGATVARTLDVRSTDLDGDGTHELTERVAEGTRCSEEGCAADGAMRERTRVLRWDARRGRYEAGALAAAQLRPRLRASRTR